MKESAFIMFLKRYWYWVLGAFVLFAFGRKFWLWLFPEKFSGINGTQTPEGEQLQITLDSYKVDESKLKLSTLEATTIANKLHEAMIGWGSGFDTQYKLLAPLSKWDRFFVYKRFGIKDYGTFWLIGKNEQDLGGWWNKEFSQSELEQMRDLFDGTKLIF